MATAAFDTHDSDRRSALTLFQSKKHSFSSTCLLMLSSAVIVASLALKSPLVLLQQVWRKDLSALIKMLTPQLNKLDCGSIVVVVGGRRKDACRQIRL